MRGRKASKWHEQRCGWCAEFVRRVGNGGLLRGRGTEPAVLTPWIGGRHENARKALIHVFFCVAAN